MYTKMLEINCHFLLETTCRLQIFGEASKEVINGEVDEIYGLTEPMEKCPMYVLSNVQKVNGACAILYENVLKNIAKRVGSDLWIVPSSIHETLLIPCETGQTFEGLQQMICTSVECLKKRTLKAQK